MNRTIRATNDGYYTKSAKEIFKNDDLHKDMSPYGVAIRESRDSEDHPESIPIIIGLDVTGSMDRIPHHFVKDGLPTMVSSLIEAGIKHPQILFMAIGDHLRDRAPLQVGQFESSDELLDKWLTSVYLEGGGGGNGGESYSLAHYFAAYHTAHDHFEKRGGKGFLFTIGDEPVHQKIGQTELREIMGDNEPGVGTVTDLINKAKERYEVFHLHVKEGSNGTDPRVIKGWQNLLNENCLVVDDHREISKIIASTIIGHLKTKTTNPTEPTSGVSTDAPSDEAAKTDPWYEGGNIL